MKLDELLAEVERPSAAGAGGHAVHTRSVLRDLASRLRLAVEAAGIVVANSKMIPDPDMKGATDCYSVPLDDVVGLRETLRKIEEGQ